MLGLLLVSCGGSGQAPVTVSVTPTSAGMSIGGPSVAFSAVVTGASEKTVTWEVSASGNTLPGAISSAGVMQPVTDCKLLGQQLTITATLVSHPASQGSATVTITLQPVNPSALVMAAGDSAQFQVGDTCAYPATWVTYTAPNGSPGIPANALGGAPFSWSLAGNAGGALSSPPNEVMSPVAIAYTAPSMPGTYELSLARNAASTAAKIVVTQPLPATAGGMSVCRTGHTATPLSNGNVLLLGSGSDPDVANTVCGYAVAYTPGSVGTSVPAVATASAEMFDPVTTQFSTAASPPYGNNWGHTATTLADGRVLVTGGYNGDNGGSVNTAQLYDPTTNTWAVTGNMTQHRAFHSAVLLADGRVLVTGGAMGTSTGEIYDPSTEQFTPAGVPIDGARLNGTSTLLANGTVLVAGGTNSVAEIYDPAVSLYASAGTLGGICAPPQSSFSVLVTMCSATPLLSGDVLFVGPGGARVYHAQPGTFSVTAGQPLISRVGSAAALLPSGQVLIAGGIHELLYTPSSGVGEGLVYQFFSNSVRIDAFQTEMYDPTTDSFIVGPVVNRRFGASATPLPNGSVLIAGGGALLGEIYH